MYDQENSMKYSLLKYGNNNNTLLLIRIIITTTTTTTTTATTTTFLKIAFLIFNVLFGNSLQIFHCL